MMLASFSSSSTTTALRKAWTAVPSPSGTGVSHCAQASTAQGTATALTTVCIQTVRKTDSWSRVEKCCKMFLKPAPGAAAAPSGAWGDTCL